MVSLTLEDHIPLFGRCVAEDHVPLFGRCVAEDHVPLFGRCVAEDHVPFQIKPCYVIQACSLCCNIKDSSLSDLTNYKCFLVINTVRLWAIRLDSLPFLSCVGQSWEQHEIIYKMYKIYSFII